MIVLHASVSEEDVKGGTLFLWGQLVAQGKGGRQKSAKNRGVISLKKEVVTLTVDDLYDVFAQFMRDPSVRRASKDRQILYLPEDFALSGEVRLLPVVTDVIWLNRALLVNLRDAVRSADIPELVDYNGTQVRLSIGESIRYWIKVMEWTEILVAREQIVPTVGVVLSGGKESASAMWRPVSAPEVNEDLKRFERSMPLVSCAPILYPRYRDAQDFSGAVTLTLNEFVDRSLASIVLEALRQRSPLPQRHQPSIIFSFVNHLFDPDLRLDQTLSQPSIRKLQEAVQAWSLDLDESFSTPRPSLPITTRLVIRLVPVMEDDPPPKNTDVWHVVNDWVMEYWVQDDDNAPYPIERLWNIKHPMNSAKQLFCLRRIARIARELPAIRSSLKTFPPTPSPIGLDEVKQLLNDEFQSGLRAIGVVVEIPHQLSVTVAKPAVKLTAKPSSDGVFTISTLVDFEWRATIDDIDIDESAFRSLVEHHVPLLRYGGRWVKLDPAEIRVLQRIWGEQTSHKTASIADLVATVEDVEEALGVDIIVNTPQAVNTASFRRMWKTFRGDFDLENVDAPKGLRASLRPYQHRGLAWMTLMGEMGLGACLADDMGLGKTVQVIAYLLRQKERDLLIRPSMVVGPLAVVANWHKEITRFAPDLSSIIHHGSDRATGDELLRLLSGPDRPDVLITSYGTAQNDATWLRQVTWQTIIADEAQNIKNPAAKNTRMIKSLQADQRIALTGTPVENRLDELWSIMDFLNPAYLGSEEGFRKTFALPIEKYGDPKASNRLKYLVRPLVLRRVKEDATVAPELPGKQETKLYCTLTPKQASLYQAVVDKMMAQIEASDGMRRRGLIFSALTQLKQICNHPALLLREATADPVDSGKLRYLIDRIKKDVEPDEKALIFTQYTQMGRLLTHTLDEQFDEDILFYHGGLSREAREGMIKQFQSESGPRLFILSLRAGGVGINLTRATHVFHYDRWWNPAVESQATDRAYRIGQTNKVQVHTLICKGTLEEHIDTVIEKKRALADEIIETGEQWITELSTAELADIFALQEVRVAI